MQGSRGEGDRDQTPGKGQGSDTGKGEGDKDQALGMGTRSRHWERGRDRTPGTGIRQIPKAGEAEIHKSRDWEEDWDPLPVFQSPLGLGHSKHGAGLWEEHPRLLVPPSWKEL